MLTGHQLFDLSRGYRSGDFTVVYLLARAASVLAIAVLDVDRGQAPNLLGWLDLLLVALGYVLAPFTWLREITLKRYWNVTTLWITVAAVGTIGYTAAILFREPARRVRIVATMLITGGTLCIILGG
ncbi:MAG: hypothetical protein QF376_01895 [Anaerolineales bacterium]|nr:hypothetical protein [Anaerolineales bacterium]